MPFGYLPEEPPKPEQGPRRRRRRRSQEAQSAGQDSPQPTPAGPPASSPAEEGDRIVEWHGFRLLPFQIQAVDAVRKGHNVLVAAPTGAGRPGG